MKKILLSLLLFFVGFSSVSFLSHTLATPAFAKVCSCNPDCDNQAPNIYCTVTTRCNIPDRNKNGVCSPCPQPGVIGGGKCSPTEMCVAGGQGRPNRCVPVDNNPPTPPPTSEDSGSDDGGSDSSDPSPATLSDLDCPINGKANAGVMTELGICIPKDPAGFTAAYYRVGLSLIGGLSVLFIIFGGYLILTSAGKPDRLNNGKTFLFYAIFGLLLTIFGYVFIEVIAVDILHLPGFGR